MILFLKHNKIFVLGMFLLLLLLFKNPLSPYNFISGLEPSPDSIHYLNPLISLAHGKGLVISYEGRDIPTTVPPLYSLTLFPIYFIFREIRFFYITNVFLTLISAILFYKIICKLFASPVIKSILFLGFVTNYIIFWYPQVAMAKNLLIPLYLFSVWLLLQPLTIFSVILFPFLTMAFFATKYVAWVLSLSLIIAFIIKVRSFKSLLKKKLLFLFLFFLSLLILFSVFAYIEFLNKEVNVLNTVILVLQNLVTVSSSGSFSTVYLKNNFIRYLAGIMGGQVTVLQKDFILLPIIVGMTSIAAIFINLLTGKNKLLSFYFFLSITGTLYFISTFYIVDARYLFVFIPIFFLISGIFLQTLGNFLKWRYQGLYFKFLMGFIYLTVILAMIPLPLGQVSNELKLIFLQPEKAKNYEAIEIMNQYANSYTLKPVIISTLSPYMIDFYSNHKYKVLPLSFRQYFTGGVEQTWGISPQGSLIDLYKDYLRESKTVLVSVYQTEDKYWFSFDMQKIKEEFNLSLAKKGCNNKCSLYKLEIKR